jgi:hypothetical protein
MPTTPSLVAPFFSQVIVGLTSFNEAYFTSDSESIQARRFGDFIARRLRYAVFWAHYECNVYRKINQWSDLLKRDYGLYTYTRSIYSPAYRLGEFWATHLMGGSLDSEAGDGKTKASALPIVTENEDLRPAIAQLWRDSNWQTNKETWTRYGAVLGDVGLMAVDDPDRQKVYLKVVHPRTIESVTKDAWGNVKGYRIVEPRPDPEASSNIAGFTPMVWYQEVATKVGEKVLYQTFRNDQPYDWRVYPNERTTRYGPEWTEEIGFVPLVMVQHREMGLGWGWSELHPAISKLHELDDLASKLDDWIRKQVESPWFFSGVLAPGNADPNNITDTTNELQVRVPESSDENLEPARSRIPTVYANDPQARATPLVAPLSVAATSAHCMSILKELERDHPELQTDMATSSGDASGRALRVARERVEAMVSQRRAGYDDGLVRAHKMAISIGAIKKYPGFEAFVPESFDNGLLDHTIGDRPVFAVDEMDRLEELKARAAVIKGFVDAGMPFESALREVGMSDEEIANVLADKAKADRAALDRVRQRQALQFADLMGSGDGGDGDGDGKAGTNTNGAAVGQAVDGQPQ